MINKHISNTGITKSNDPLSETTDGKINFWGVVKNNIKSFRIDNWGENTRAYNFKMYENTIAPYFISKPIDEITEDDIAQAINYIRLAGYYKNGFHQYEQKTLNQFKFLIGVVFDFAASNQIIPGNPMFGSEIDLSDQYYSDEEEEHIKLRKSLTVSEEISVAEQVLCDPGQNGELMGVALMFALGLRNSEACALDFGDIREIPEKPNNFCVWIYKTTKKNTNIVKASGKTKNADRIIPLTSKMADFIEHRKIYLINQLLAESFELELEHENIDDLPIVCVGQNFKKRSNANLLSAAGKEVLKNASLDSKVLGFISKSINDMPVLEKEPTAYLFRRNFATHLHILGLEESEIQYIVGHEIEDSAEMRNFFSNTDKLWPIKLKMDNRPLVSDYYYCKRPIFICDNPTNERLSARITDDIWSSGEQFISLKPSVEKDYKIKIEAATTEPREPINVHIEMENVSENIEGSMFISDNNNPAGISSVLRAYHDAYEHALSRIAVEQKNFSEIQL